MTTELFLKKILSCNLVVAKLPIILSWSFLSSNIDAPQLIFYLSDNALLSFKQISGVKNIGLTDSHINPTLTKVV